MPSSEAAAAKNSPRRRRGSSVTKRRSEVDGSRKKKKKSKVSSRKTRTKESMETASTMNMSTFGESGTGTTGDCQEDDTTTGSGEGLPRLSKVFAKIPEKKKCKIPETYFKVVIIHMNMPTPREHELVFSPTLVIRTIGKNSPFFCHFVVGDQILEINDHTPLVPEDILRLMKKARPAKFRIVRPWNVKHIGIDRKPATRNKDCSYHVAEVHKDVEEKNGFEMKSRMGKAIVSVVDPKSRGGHAFLNGDRIIDVEGETVPLFGNLKTIKKQYNSVIKEKGVVSFVVERILGWGLRSSPNPSLCAARSTEEDFGGMGDDAAEIGAREATRWRAMKDTYNPCGILKENVTQLTLGTTANDEDTTGFEDGKKKKRTSKRKKRRSTCNESRNEVPRVPSDVKGPAVLQQVAKKSGLAKFMSRYLK